MSKSTTSTYNAGEFESYLSSTDPLLRRMGLLQICAEPGERFTNGQIAEFTGYTRQRIDQLEKSAFRKLAAALADKAPELVQELFPKYKKPCKS